MSASIAESWNYTCWYWYSLKQSFALNGLESCSLHPPPSPNVHDFRPAVFKDEGCVHTMEWTPVC